MLLIVVYFYHILQPSSLFIDFIGFFSVNNMSSEKKEFCAFSNLKAFFSWSIALARTSSPMLNIVARMNNLFCSES